MRTAFIETLQEMARTDERIMLLVGDLGFGVVIDFMEELPDQFLNVGVAEQNMTGIAAGLALSGKSVFTYSIANFPILRPLEQIRNDICYHQVDVTIVAVGGGMSYGALGSSHHATEDLAITRALPNMTVVAPGDPVETRLATRALVEYRGPAYLRIGRANERIVHQSPPEFELGQAITVRQGSDITLIATGSALYNTVQAAEQLAQAGIDARVLSMHTLKPLDKAAILQAARETDAIFTVEDHNIIGGLGSAVAEVLAESASGACRFGRIGLPDQFATVVGDENHLRAHFGLDADGIVRSVQEVIPSRLKLDR